MKLLKIVKSRMDTEERDGITDTRWESEKLANFLQISGHFIRYISVLRPWK